MKKKTASVVAVAALSALMATSALAAQPITVTIDGETLQTEQAPVIQDNRTLVPMRAIFEALGAEVEWDDATRSITATRDDKTIEMTIGQTEMTVDGEAVTLEVAPTILNNTTLVPVRAVAESFDAQVGWNEANRRVIINTIPTKTLSETVKAEDGTELITISATYPILENPDHSAAIDTINASLKKSAEDYVAAAKKDHQDEVEKFYEEFKDEATFLPYAFEQTVALEFVAGDFISGVTTDYAYTGGAHPNTVKTGFTYSTSNGKLLTLDEALEGADKLRERAVAAFQEKIAADPGLYFADAATTVEQEIDQAQFYLAPDGVHFLFQPYDIAPYAAGFQEVTISYPEV